jgi:hypothetical protein
MKRFSKAKIVANLIDRAALIQKKWGLDPSNGTAQVRNSSIERAVEYGRFSAMLDISYDIRSGYIGYAEKEPD